MDGTMWGLRPCPFCGGEAVDLMGKTKDGRTTYTVCCINCRTAIFRPTLSTLPNVWDGYKSIDEAAQAWNRRAKDE